MKQETHRVRWVEFVAEQDGESEQVLKTRLMERFRSSSGLIEAYLVSVCYDNAPELKVALCLRMDKGIPDIHLVKTAGEEFAHLFNRTQSLDTLFLNPVQDQPTVTVAHPFYRRALTGNP